MDTQKLRDFRRDPISSSKNAPQVFRSCEKNENLAACNSTSRSVMKQFNSLDSCLMNDSAFLPLSLKLLIFDVKFITFSSGFNWQLIASKLIISFSSIGIMCFLRNYAAH